MRATIFTMKAFISQLWDIVGIGTPSSQQTQIFIGDTEITSNLNLWIQGVIVKIETTTPVITQAQHPPQFIVHIDDGTSTIVCSNAKNRCNMPKGTEHEFNVGDYIMVYGSVRLDGAFMMSTPSKAASTLTLAANPSSALYNYRHVTLETDRMIFLGTDGPNMETLWITEVMVSQDP